MAKIVTKERTGGTKRKYMLKELLETSRCGRLWIVVWLKSMQLTCQNVRSLHRWGYSDFERVSGCEWRPRENVFHCGVEMIVPMP